MTTPAEAVNCCLAPSKESCVRPPCPCNLESWTREERIALAASKRIEAGK